MSSTAHPDAIAPIRQASRRLVRELGFMRGTLAGTDLSPSAAHALVEIGQHGGGLTASGLCELLMLEKSSVSRMLGKLVAGGLLREQASRSDARAKTLALTAAGRKVLAGIDRFATGQVAQALAYLPPAGGQAVAEGLARYADALQAARTGQPPNPLPAAGPAVEIHAGYRPGVIGRVAEMHAAYYGRTAGFGQFFEAQVASGIAAFTGRLEQPGNGLWTAVRAGTIAGHVAIDGQDLGPGKAHLRWFIMDDGLRGSGAGRRLLSEALGHCDRLGFAETHLWTFSGLHAARHLYEAHGFVLAEEKPGGRWGAQVLEQRFVRRAGPGLSL